MYILDNSYPTLRGCQVIHNTAEPINNMHGFAGGIALSGAAAWWFMDQCEVRGNEADAAGGIGLTGGEPLISNTIIEQNSALRIAGGVLSNNGEPHLENCLIARNSAQYGGGLYAYNLAAPELVHCTVAKNSAPTGADVYAGADSHPVLINSILWGNTGDLLYVEPDCTISAEFTNLQGGLPGKGFKIMSLDPLFAGSEDFHLTAASPCINACEFEFFSTDLDGHPRTICELPDMGAYEFGLGDFNCDRVLNAADAAGWSICMLGPGDDWSEPACSALDANADDRVDLRDWAAIQNLFGAN
jgi:hypothetical protein